MASPLESAITLEDVFAMVIGKRVPLAPELAGYLSLEIAEKADAAKALGDVDPRAVYIADEGTVALVVPRGGGEVGDAEQSIRTILGELLNASGSSTPALTGVARRARTGSLRGLMEDIEAALIPVNRAAGRRALARLAREVKRVTHGVGRNAAPARPASRPAMPAVNPRARRPPDEAPTLRSDRPELPEPRPPPRHPGGTGAGLGPAVPLPADLAPQPVERREAPAQAAARPRTGRSQPPPAMAATDAEVGALFDNPGDVDSLLEQFSRSTTQSEKAVSDDLKGLVDVGETAEPPSVHPRSIAPAGDIDDLLALSGDIEAVAPSAPAAESRRPHSSFAPAPVPLVEAPRPKVSTPSPQPVRPRTEPYPLPSQIPTGAAPGTPPSSRGRESALPAFTVMSERSAQVQQAATATDAEWARPRKKRTDYWVIIALLAVLAAASAAVWLFKPGFLSGRTAEKVAEERAANEALRQKNALAQQALSCRAALDVTDVPSGAEVLLRVGQAPVDVPHLPVGARLEFVATAEGFAPKRAVVPAGATWDTGPDGKPRFETAVQLDHSNPKAKLGDVWPPGEAGSEVGGKGPPGTVHIVSTPRGAEIWMLAGIGPEALVEQLPCDQPVDVLVAGPTTFRKRLHAAPADFGPRPGETQSRIAKLSAR